jgi:hypothetical protein
MHKHSASKAAEGRKPYNELRTSAQVMLHLPLHLLDEVWGERFVGLT